MSCLGCLTAKKKKKDDGKVPAAPTPAVGKAAKGAVHDENVSATAAAEKEKAQIRQKDVKIRLSKHQSKLSSSSAADTSAAAVAAPDSTAVTPAGMVSATHVKVHAPTAQREQGDIDALSKTSSMASPVLQRMIHTSSSIHMDINDVYEMKGGRVLGTGVTGAVRVVQHKLTGKEYAHKLLRISRVRSNRKRKQMYREIQVLKTLDHPNIVKIHEVFEYANGDLSIVMELCRGDELFEKLLAEKPHYRFLQDDVRRIALKMFSALNYIHLNNLVHRDIKRECLGVIPQTLHSLIPERNSLLYAGSLVASTFMH